MGFLFRFFLILFALCPGVHAASPDAVSPWSQTPQGNVRLVSATTGIGGPHEPSEVRLGLEFDLLPGWKIYWHSPGEAGTPPQIDWQGSENVHSFRWRWPAPERFTFFGLETVGYKGRIILPIDALADDPAQPVRLRARLSFLVCSDICVPQSATLSLDLDGGWGRPGAAYSELERFRALEPGDGVALGLSLTSAIRFEKDGKHFVRLTLRSRQDVWRTPDVFLEGPGSYGAPVVSLSEDGYDATLTIEDFLNLPSEGLSVTVVDGNRAFHARTDTVPLVAPPGPSVPDALPVPPADRTFVSILLLALTGGLILNVMPCVLPVLSLKALGILRLTEHDTSHVRLSFLVSAAGIMVSFWLLALTAITIKSAGIAVGWGIQFQQPAFLIFMIAILCFFSANLSGWFEIPLPSWIAGFSIDRRTTLSSHFFSGMLATLLATPCSAPFLGTAVGFALARGPSEILAVFTALGLGLSLPYLAMSLWPRLVYRLPRPGRWMLTVRRLLGAALLATAVWLGSVLGHQLGWFEKEDTADIWVPLDPPSIPKLVSEGNVVFVDVTADWCLTCKLNKVAVLERQTVRERLNDPAVIRMRGDWTQPDDMISAYLNSFGRYGIPFNAVYSRSHPSGAVLPELLTEAVVLDALDSALGLNKK